MGTGTIEAGWRTGCALPALVAALACIATGCGDSGGGPGDADAPDDLAAEAEDAGADADARDGGTDEADVPADTGEADEGGTDDGGTCPEPTVTSARLLTDDCKSVDWYYCPDILTEATIETPPYFDVTTVDATSGAQECITCGLAPFRYHDGNPSWHPGCEWIALTAFKDDVREDVRLMLDALNVTVPGRGILHDLWAINRTTRAFHELAEVSSSTDLMQGMIHPQFSHDGNTIIWAERVDKDEGDDRHQWGKWALKIADFAVGGDGVPELQNVRSCQPHPEPGQVQFYETHGFSPDDGVILYAANAEEGQPPTALDLYTVEFTTADCGAPTRLTEDTDITESGGEWDEHAHFSPDGTRIAWMSSEGLHLRYGPGPDPEDYREYDAWPDYLKSELWIMNADGTCPRRLTDFNRPGGWELTPRVDTSQAMVADSSWSADGRLAVAVMYRDAGGGWLRELYLLDIEE